jgi:hypothetical protein
VRCKTRKTFRDNNKARSSTSSAKFRVNGARFGSFRKSRPPNDQGEGSMNKPHTIVAGFAISVMLLWSCPVLAHGPKDGHTTKDRLWEDSGIANVARRSDEEAGESAFAAAIWTIAEGALGATWTVATGL